MVSIVITIDSVLLLIYLEIDDLHRLEKTDKMRRKILNWLSPDDFDETHDMHFRKRFENTGQWLLDDPRFLNWRQGTRSSLLWCYGARKYHNIPLLYMHLY